MEIEGWSQTMGAGPLLGIAAGAIALLLLLVMKFKFHAFPALILVSLLTAVATGIPLDKVTEVATAGMAKTLGDVAQLIGLGAMIGGLLEASGGARVLAHKLLDVFGEDRAPLALGVASLVFGFPMFFDVGLVVMLPVVFSVARWVGGSALLYALPSVGAFSVMHVFVPPHPGPVTAAGFFDTNIGILLVVGLVVSLPTWYLAVYLYSKIMGRRIELPVSHIFGDAEVESPAHPPRWGTVLCILVLPMVLILANTTLAALVTAGVLDGSVEGTAWFQAFGILGTTPVALLITLVVAIFVLGVHRGQHKERIQELLEKSLPAMCSVILVTGAGGMFGGVLRSSGIGQALADVLEGLGIPLILAGFLIAGVMRVAQGSATVALTTAAGLIAPGVAAAHYNPVQVAALTVAVAAGSVILSHFNDGGFWLVGKFLQMDVRTTLRTWTVMETLIGVVGFGIAALLFGLGALLG